MKDTSKSNPDQKKNPEKQNEKKTYHSPELQIYGSLDRLTNGRGGLSSDKDGTSKPGNAP